jgi:hypothetical protein
MTPTLKLLSPEMIFLGTAEHLIGCAGNSRTRVAGEHGRPTPGSERTSSQRMRLHGNKGDPRRCSQSLRLHRQTSLTSKNGDIVARKSEPPVRAVKLGNAGGAKGRRSETSVRRSMDQTLSWAAP